jgi:hypothetical protein
MWVRAMYGVCETKQEGVHESVHYTKNTKCNIKKIQKIQMYVYSCRVSVHNGEACMYACIKKENRYIYT